ncbi:MAG TPA: hypothetical protein VN611_07195 [Patescibacteria group bacterium]|nr:hypothetical protein [Patescibacteria group bacterium]
MKRRVLLLGLLILLTMAFSATAFAGAQDFDLVNATGKAITHVYVSPHNVNDWQEDVLGREILDDGDSVAITFGGGERATYWDIKAIFEDGSSIFWENFNLKSISVITLQGNGRAVYQ